MELQRIRRKMDRETVKRAGVIPPFAESQNTPFLNKGVDNKSEGAQNLPGEHKDKQSFH
jgi:hypothetical protein